MKFLFISPVESTFIGSFNIAYGIAPPLGLLYLGRILEDEGEKVDVLDFSAEEYSVEKLRRALSGVDVVGMSVVSPSIEKAQEIIQTVKEKDPEIPTIIGGPHCMILPDKALIETGADISVHGDGELVITDLKKMFLGEKTLSDIPGVFYKKDNVIKKGAPVKFLEKLDSIPFPARHLVKKYVYGRPWKPRIKGGEFTTIVTGRGCPYKCSFCSRGAVTFFQHRGRSTSDILDELRDIHSKGYKYVAFMDDSFLSNKKQAHMIFDTMIHEQLNMRIYITASRCDSADKELYQKMKRAGVIRIQFGLESGNQDVLDFYNKKTTVEKIRNAVTLSQKSGFVTCGTFILGAPFETYQHFDNTIEFAKSIPLDSVSFLPLRYMVGADLWNDAVDSGKITSDEYIITADSKRNLGQYTQQELLKYCKKANKAFYYRPNYLFNLLKYSLRKNDFSLPQIFISILASSIKRNLRFYRSNSLPKEQSQQENDTTVL
jgi:anaerobic magnesium-protoporphyrin IX monomethyl ester cyclase